MPHKQPSPPPGDASWNSACGADAPAAGIAAVNLKVGIRVMQVLLEDPA